MSRSEWLDHAVASTGFMVASGGVLFEGYGCDGPGVCLGDGQMEAYLKDMGMTGLAAAWAMDRRRAIARRRPIFTNYSLIIETGGSMIMTE